MNKVQEKLLLVRIQKGKDPEAFSELYDHLADPIYRFIFFKVSSKEIAQDITADVFLKTWKELTKNKKTQVKQLKAFIYIIARNKVIDHYRKSAKEQYVPLEHHEAEALSVQTQQAVETKIDAQQILQLTDKLKDSYQEILLLRHVDELSLQEIALIIEKTPVATRVLLHRAQKALQREYEKIT